jgi:hypothetical protein
MKTSQIVIERKSSKDIKMRDLYVRVDDLPEETILYGDTLELSLPPGEHQIKVTNRVGSRSLDFTLKEGETKRFVGACVSSRSLLSILMMIVGTVGYKVALWEVTSSSAQT